MRRTPACHGSGFAPAPRLPGVLSIEHQWRLRNWWLKKKETKKKRRRGTCVLVSPIMNGTAAAGQSSRLQIVATSEARYRCSPSQAGWGQSGTGVQDHSGNQKCTHTGRNGACQRHARPWPLPNLQRPGLHSHSARFDVSRVWHTGLSAPRWGPQGSPSHLVPSHPVAR